MGSRTWRYTRADLELMLVLLSLRAVTRERAKSAFVPVDLALLCGWRWAASHWPLLRVVRSPLNSHTMDPSSLNT